LNDSTSMTRQAYLALDADIVSLRLKPGTMLSEGDLRERYGMGRTPIREALHRLEREGLVEIHPRRGVRVTQVDVFQQLDLLEARRPLERLLAKCAALRATQEERAEMLKIAAELDTVGEDTDNEHFRSLNRQSQRAVAKASKNEVIVSLYGLLHGMSRRFWSAYHRQYASLAEGARLHCLLLRAVAAGDVASAEAQATELIDYLEEFARKVLNKEIVK